MPAQTFDSEERAVELMKIMANLGIVFLDANYSGGHDEGGLQEINVARTNKGENVAKEHNKGFADELWSAADAVLTCKYGGWAWEGYAYGHLYADAKNGRVWTEGGEEIAVDRKDEDPIEVTISTADFSNAVDPKDKWRAAVMNGETLESYATWQAQRRRG